MRGVEPSTSQGGEVLRNKTATRCSKTRIQKTWPMKDSRINKLLWLIHTIQHWKRIKLATRVMVSPSEVYRVVRVQSAAYCMITCIVRGWRQLDVTAHTVIRFPFEHHGSAFIIIPCTSTSMHSRRRKPNKWTQKRGYNWLVSSEEPDKTPCSKEHHLRRAIFVPWGSLLCHLSNQQVL